MRVKYTSHHTTHAYTYTHTTHKIHNAHNTHKNTLKHIHTRTLTLSHIQMAQANTRTSVLRMYTTSF